MLPIHALFYFWGGRMVTLGLMERGAIFHDGDVEVRWDEGEVQRHAFSDEDELLSMWGPVTPGEDADVFVHDLLSHRELRVRVTKWRDERVTDRFNLDGVANEIDALECSG